MDLINKTLNGEGNTMASEAGQSGSNKACYMVNKAELEIFREE